MKINAGASPGIKPPSFSSICILCLPTISQVILKTWSMHIVNVILEKPVELGGLWSSFKNPSQRKIQWLCFTSQRCPTTALCGEASWDKQQFETPTATSAHFVFATKSDIKPVFNRRFSMNQRPKFLGIFKMNSSIYLPSHVIRTLLYHLLYRHTAFRTFKIWQWF